LQLGALVALTAGTAPGAFADALRAGIALRVAPRWRRLSLPVDLSVESPGRFADTARNASVSALPVQLSAGLCGHPGARIAPYFCGTAAFTAVVAEGRGYRPDNTDVAYALALGARAGVEVPLSTRWSFVAELDLRALALRTALALRDPAVGVLWTAPPVAASLSLGVAWTNR
jgi:hypothetical protein